MSRHNHNHHHQMTPPDAEEVEEEVEELGHAETYAEYKPRKCKSFLKQVLPIYVQY